MAFLNKMDAQYVYESKAWPMKTHRPRRAIEDSTKNDDAPECKLRFHTQDSTSVIYHQQGHPPRTYTTRLSRSILRRSLKFPQHILLGDIEVLTSNMTSILTSLGIPIEFQRSIVLKIHDMYMIQNSGKFNNTRSLVSRMAVLITTVACNNYLLESPGESAFGHCCAPASSVVALERTIIKENNFMDYDCVVCMDKFVVGVKVIKMPCSHAFHDGCIKEWLRGEESLVSICNGMCVDSSQRRLVL